MCVKRSASSSDVSEMRSRHVVAAATVLVVVSAALVIGVGRGGSAETDVGLPLLGEAPDFTIERDMPDAVQKRLADRQRRQIETLRRAGSQQPSRAAGCVPNRAFSGHLGPPLPDLEARIIGHYAEVVFRYSTLPTSAACRPVALIASVTGARTPTATNSSTSTLPWRKDVLLTGKAGRLLVHLPWIDGSRAPFVLRVSVFTMNGRRSDQTVTRLTCPSQGCLTGAQLDPYPDHPSEARVFPLRNTTGSRVLATIRYILATDQAGTSPHARCSSPTRCIVTYTDASFPRSPYRLELTIGGDQVPGCWFVTATRPLAEPPYEDAPTDPRVEAGCNSWVEG